MDYYYNVAGFLNDEEVHKVWNIVGNALERQGYNCLLYTSPSPRDS